MDLRCKFCNWLNREVKENFVCANCKKQNGYERKEDIKEEEDENKIFKKKKYSN